ncbi:MAG: rhodanese-like domain-containing protein [Desulfobacterales bacterium]
MILIAGSATGDNSLSDAQKKEVVYAMYAGYKKDFPAVKDISPQQAMALLKTDEVVFVDTRKPAEMKVSMLPHAITRNEFLNHPEKYAGKTVVGYCTVSYRSGVFAREMDEKGFSVRNLEGGILAWTLEGGKVYDENGKETNRIHVYGKKWNYAPAGYKAVMFSLWEQMF